MPSFYKDIYGYFDFENIYSFIANNFPNGKFVEIGSWLGKSTCFMAETLKELNSNSSFYTIDTFLGEINATDQQEIIQKNGGNIYKAFLDNMKNANVLDYVTPLMLSSTQAATLFDDNSLDFVFIDAEHIYEFVKQDLNTWFAKIKKNGGIIAGHDYNNQVKQAVDEFFIGKNLTIRSINSSWLVQTL